MKIEIKHRWTGAILFSVKADTWKLAVEAAIEAKANLSFADLSFADLSFADLSFANLSFANLSSADLSFADLSFADLSFADLSFANLRSANLRSADLTVIRNDLWSVLLFAQAEIKALRKAIVEGKINGSMYAGDCACLIGTIAKQRKCSVDSLGGNLKPDASRPAERFFMGISPGHTPENNPVSKIALEWLDQFVAQTK